MNIWLAFGLINTILCVYDIHKQGVCKAVDLLSTIIMFLAGPFGTALVLLHVYAQNINNTLERVIWQRHKSYNDFLEINKRGVR